MTDEHFEDHVGKDDGCCDCLCAGCSTVHQEGWWACICPDCVGLPDCVVHVAGPMGVPAP